MKQEVLVKNMGAIAYQEAWTLQGTLQQALIDAKLHNRELSPDDPTWIAPKHQLLLCEHPHVYTLGKSGKIDNLLLNEEELVARDITFHKINRGGDITYHGPGQIVMYPIFDLDYFFNDVHRYVNYIEEAVIRTLAEYGIYAERMAGFTGIWLPATATLPNRKIGAIGVHLSRWVSMHGLGFNVNTDLEYFKNIIPCGIAEVDKDVTSLAQELGHPMDMQEVQKRLVHHMSELFGFKSVFE